MLVLFVLITLIFALLGMTLFGGSFGSYAPGEPPAEPGRDRMVPVVASACGICHLRSSDEDEIEPLLLP